MISGPFEYCENAAQAMMGAETSELHCLVVTTRETEQWCIIEIKDNGPGLHLWLPGL
jgi:C4-dicarboxylate-specific signal transduction histidine kinase